MKKLIITIKPQHLNFPLGLNYKDIEEFENDFPRVYKV